MSATILPVSVIERDHKLEVEADRAGGALAELRWHWTLDESNPDRVGFREYARQVGRNESVIRSMANGCAASQRTGRPIQEAVASQYVKQADRDITNAVAKATKTSVTTVRKAHQEDVRRVRNTVADIRESEPDMSPEREQEVIETSAQMIAREREATKARQQQRRKSKPMQFLVIEGKIQRARDAVDDALNTARTELELGELDDELVTALQDAANRLRAVVGMLQTALGIEAETDWDAEFSKMAGGVS